MCQFALCESARRQRSVLSLWSCPHLVAKVVYFKSVWDLAADGGRPSVQWEELAQMRQHLCGSVVTKNIYSGCCPPPTIPPLPLLLIINLWKNKISIALEMNRDLSPGGRDHWGPFPDALALCFGGGGGGCIGLCSDNDVGKWTTQGPYGRWPERMGGIGGIDL